MAKSPENNPTSIKQRLLNLARQDQSDFGVVLIAYALERLVYRLSITDHRQNFILKGGMLVTLWAVNQSRFTRDVDFLSFGSEDEESLISIFNDILSTDAQDGLRFDTAALTATQIHDDHVYGGVRLKTTAYLCSGWPKVSKTFRIKRDAEDWGRTTEDEIIRGIYIPRNHSEKLTIAQRTFVSNFVH